MKNNQKFSHCSFFIVLFLALQMFSVQFSIAEELTTTKESISFGDILALQAQGLLPKYDYVRKVKKDKNIDWGHTTGERDEIGLLPEQHAAYIAGQRNLLPSILQTALKPPPSAISHEHKPNLYWLPYLMTGDVQYVRNMEATWKQFKDWRRMPYDSPFDYYDQGRHLAWTLRDLAQLAYLQKLGVTEHHYYIPALEASYDYFINRTKNSLHKRWNVLGFNYITEDSFGWTSWMESFVGQALNHLVSLGFKNWKPIAEFQYKNLEKRSGGEWPLKDVDSDHIFFQNFNKTLSGKALRAWAKTQTWQDISAYPPWMIKKPGYQQVPDDQLVPADRQINGNFFTYRQRAQYAYGWAALACHNKITGACDKARELMKAITKRGDQWSVKNKILFESVDRYVKPVPTKSKLTVRKKDYWKGWDNLPLDEFVLVPDAGGASNIGKLLKEAGFGREKYKGSVRGSFTAWVGAAHDLDSGVIYVPWGGGHADSTLNGIWKFDIEAMKWSIEKMPSDPYKTGAEWSKSYLYSGSYTLYSEAVSFWPRDVLPDHTPTSRHTYGGVWYDSKRKTINQSRLSWWSYNINSKKYDRKQWKKNGKKIAPTINHALFYDELKDRVYGGFTESDYDYFRFVEINPEKPAYKSLGTPITNATATYCRYDRTIYEFASPNSGEQWAEFNMDSKRWKHGNTSGAPDYDYSQEMQGCVYIPEWNKILRQFTSGKLKHKYYLYNPTDKKNIPYTPAGKIPKETKIGNKLFYYPARNAILYVGADNVYVMRVK